MKQYSGLLITIVIVLSIGAFLFFAPEKSLPYAPVNAGGGSITVQDQTAGDIVQLSSDLAAPGFITIHEAMGEAPGRILGISDYLETGSYGGVNIFLTEPMIPGLTYITLLHADDGDQIFDVDYDMPVVVNGEVVRPSFVALSVDDVDEFDEIDE